MAPSTSGIRTSDSGERHVPASTRADGSTRKEIKIRPGYRPPEDVEVYKNRTAEAWKTRGSGSVPGAAAVSADNEVSSKASNKNAKRREARKKAKENASEEGHPAEPEEGSKPDNTVAIDEDVAEAAPAPSSAVSVQEVGSKDKDKQIRNLRKKLRQAQELNEKKEKGEPLLPDQFAKISKIDELLQQLEDLGLGSNEVSTGD